MHGTSPVRGDKRVGPGLGLCWDGMGEGSCDGVEGGLLEMAHFFTDCPQAAEAVPKVVVERAENCQTAGDAEVIAAHGLAPVPNVWADSPG